MSETRKLYIADWHYAHANILAFDNRPFKTVEEMNEELVKRWNATVNPGDTFFKTMPELMVYWALPVGGLAESGQSEDPPHIIKLSFLKSIVPCPVNV